MSLKLSVMRLCCLGIAFVHRCLCWVPKLRRQSCSTSLSASTPYVDAVSEAASKALGRTVVLERTEGGGRAGGSGASASAVVDKETDTRYFLKSAGDGYDMLHAEFLGVQEIQQTNTIQCPTPIVCGVYETTNTAFCLFEYLEMCGGGSQYELGQQLARMHRSTSTEGFGFHVNNTIGATPQPNTPWMESWSDFWLEKRLNHMLRLTDNAGLTETRVEALKQKTSELLSHNPPPSLIHGDLWGGNKGFCRDNDGNIIPVIFDPATYYGDREADIAMTHLFGGFAGDFYDGYESEWALPSGHEQRRTVYNLYHILNHEILFGGMYLNQASRMIDRILSY